MRYGKDPRVKDSLGIAVHVINDDGAQGARTLHMTEDISRFGLSFRHDQPLPVDSNVRILVAMRSPARTITKLGRVCWSQPGASGAHRIGIALTAVTQWDGIFWNSYVTDLQRATA